MTLKEFLEMIKEAKVADNAEVCFYDVFGGEGELEIITDMVYDDNNVTFTNKEVD